MEQVVDISHLFSRNFCNPPARHSSVSISLVNFSSGILAFLTHPPDRGDSWLFAVNVQTKRPQSPRQSRLRFLTRLQSTNRLFVRNDESYLYYGVHSSVGNDGYHKWDIMGFDLTASPARPLTEKPWSLNEFAGYEIGQTACFEVHCGCLYAVTNLVGFVLQEIDWTSFYMWACLSPTRTPPGQLVELKKIWRRQHREGPLNDSWTDISLRKEEATGRLLILECRREWRNGGSTSCRTYYKSPLPSPDEFFEPAPLKDVLSSSTSSCCSSPSVQAAQTRLPDEPLAHTVSTADKPNYAPPKKRARRDYHSEYDEGTDTRQRHDFILAKTRFRTYNLLSSTFVDLVNDPDLQPAGLRIPRDRLRLRMVSRKRRCPIDTAGEEGQPGSLFRPEPDFPNSIDNAGKGGKSEPGMVEHSEERFVSRGVRFWPPDDAPSELYDLLGLTHKATAVFAAADERTFVYMIGPASGAAGAAEDADQANADNTRKTHHRAIVCITFDPLIRLAAGMKRLTELGLGAVAVTAEDAVSNKRGKLAPVSHLGADEAFSSPRLLLPCCSVSPAAHAADKSSNPVSPNITCPTLKRRTSCFREEPAMYTKIGRSYWLRE